MSSASEVNPRAVFVVHGRNLAARNAVFDFLKAIDLRPLEWDVVAGETRSGAPFVFEILERGFEIAQAVIVILTPDEEVTLRPTLRTEPNDAKSRYQPRPNVLFEAGMAFMRDRRRTILLEFGLTDMLSDLHGVHALQVRSGSGAEMRKRLADRLRTAGCPVSTEGSDWLSAGNFDAAFLNETSGSQPDGATSGGAVQDASRPETEPSVAPRPGGGNTAMASGARSVAVGRNARNINTGDNTSDQKR
jgi:hypothetical protein